jgi:hypothetical protein
LWRRCLVVALPAVLTFLLAPGISWASGGATTFLRAGDRIDSCQEVASPSGRYLLQLGCDGNLKLIEDQQTELWDSETSGIGAATLEMQHDGNLVLYSEGHVARWETGTAGNAEAALGIQDDGNMVVIATGNVPVWATGTDAVAAPSPGAAPAAPPSVSLASLGTREKNLHDRLPIIASAASEWAIDEQLLAAIVHHEGGAYLDFRRTGDQVRDYAIAELKRGSVGIAQIRIDTARRMLEQQYGIAGLDDETIAVNLIRDDDVSIRLAAANLSSLQYLNVSGKYCGGANSRELFLLYAVNGKLACTLRDYNFDLDKLGQDVAVDLYTGVSPPATQDEVSTLKDRDKHYASSWAQADLVLRAV